MLDVIHYFFDQDNNYQTGEQAEAHSAIRRSIFKEWYGIDYKYGVPSKNQAFGEQSFVSTENFDLSSEEIIPVDPFSKARKSDVKPDVKPFVPATNFDENTAKPFGSVLDAPLG